MHRSLTGFRQSQLRASRRHRAWHVSCAAWYSNQEITAITRPKLCRQVSPTQMMLYAKYLKGFGRGSQFGMVTF